ncbi:NMDA RECEPTOR SUBUNIT EPSILON-1 putative (DUF3598)-RELATED [Salix koriyanagi]|uniref:NMDA RECEPTOR SUBUNIT EPSILON-1 putative (DUF3598)-RELATED n=1 Tax=Salix koriyanagi TaxID=2511006 RepID=A0A9Q0UY40_9ROSI|nr:NMDA RECEPTOR SUBUNIT EPSILON-1 putative (DUF3598)-RELATED [Salix koriyanagi]
MASICNSLTLPPKLSFNPNPLFTASISTSWSPKIRPTTPRSSSSSTRSVKDDPKSPEPISIDNLRRFFDLSIGKWHGSFHQFDAKGKLMQKVSTKLAVSSYGEDELISLIQTLYIKQSSSSTSISSYDEEPEWAEYKIKETNMFTADKYQQIGFFPNERAFFSKVPDSWHVRNCVKARGCWAKMILEKNHQKTLSFLLVSLLLFVRIAYIHKRKTDEQEPFISWTLKAFWKCFLSSLRIEVMGCFFHPSLESNSDSLNRISPLLGKWKGHSQTKRSGVYGATVAEADTITLLELDDKGHLIQDISSTSDGGDVTTNVRWIGTRSDDLITFDGGYQITLLPGGMYMGCPSDIATNVAGSKSFHLEFCWLESPETRQRLVRTYDVDGLAVSSTYFSETKM